MVRHRGLVKLPDHQVELLHPLGEKSTIANFLARNADGGIHHVCYGSRTCTPRATSSRPGRARAGRRRAQDGAHDKPVLFLRPKDFTGTLIELEQV